MKLHGNCCGEESRPSLYLNMERPVPPSYFLKQNLILLTEDQITFGFCMRACLASLGPDVNVIALFPK